MDRKHHLLAVILLLFFPSVWGQQLALKTNLLYWATSTPNASVEVVLNNRFSLDVSGSYNAWKYSNSLSLKHYLFQPELRYWIACKPFESHFVGVHGHYGKYNLGRTDRVRGDLLGAGVSYGYHWLLGRRWGLEATIGLGFTSLHYKKYHCADCAELQGEYRRKFFGPSRIGVSIIYMIN